jgi:amidase
VVSRTLWLSQQGELCHSISPLNRPTLTIDPGDTVMVETEDAFGGVIRTKDDEFDPLVYRSLDWTSNPLTGPIFVKEAKKGDTLVVEIKDIKPTIGQGVATVLDLLWLLSENATARFLDVKIPAEKVLRRICPIKDRKVYWSEKVVLPYRPMIGEIATAPGAVMPNPGCHGGNMDLPEVSIGSKLFMPVYVPGALLHVGDAHAAQGEAELSGVAIEMPAECTLAVDLIRSKTIRWPRLETADYIMSVASSTTHGASLRDAIRIAFMELVLWLEEEYRFDRWDAYQLCTQVAKVTIGNITCVGAKFPKEYL